MMNKSSEQDLCIEFLIGEIVSIICEEKKIPTLEAYELFYKTDISKKIEDIETGYYLEGAAYMYELVKKELKEKE